MASIWHPSLRAALGASVLLAILSGCASPQRSEQVLEWVVSSEAQKKKLDDEGFPQYVGGN